MPLRTRRAAASITRWATPRRRWSDLEAAASLRPDNAVDLDRLGQTYLAFDRTGDAVRVLRKAAALSPDDSKTQLHLARALADAGQEAESKAAMDRFRQLGPAVNRAVPGGLVDYLSLSPEQRRADYLARVERQVRQHPDDAQANVNYLRLLLEDGDADRAAETARKIAGLKPPAAVLADAGRALLEARQYGPARELLEQAAKAAPSAGLELDLAIAAFHESGPAEGARLLDRIPDSRRGGDYYLARAEILEASGASQEAAAAVDRALSATPVQPRLYMRACVILLHAGRTEDALRISAAAMTAFAQDREILLLRAVILEKAGRTAEAEPLLQRIENRWPEWPDAWTADGVILGTQGAAIERARRSVPLCPWPPAGQEVKAYLDELSSGAEWKAAGPHRPAVFETICTDVVAKTSRVKELSFSMRDRIPSQRLVRMGSTTIVRSEPAVCDQPEELDPAPEEVRGQLVRLLASPLFQHSKHYPVSCDTSSARPWKAAASHLKERALGVDVFSRDPNYDTNADPVVRTTACEVRKRIAQYYHEPGHEDEIRIDLPSGAYVPEFRFALTKPLPSPSADSPSNPEIAALTLQPKRWNWIVAAAVTLSLCAAGILWSRPWTPGTALDRFWSPVVNSRTPVLMCISGVLNQEPPNSTPGFPSSDSTVRDMLRWNRVPFSDALALSSLMRFLGSRNQHPHVRLAASLKLEDLRDGPAVLIGAFNNHWTLRLAAPDAL